MQTASIAAKKTAEKADEPNVDKMKTASIAPRVSPKLNAKARKKVIRKDVKAVDIRKDDKAEVIRKDVKAEEMPAATASTSGVQYGSIVARYAESYGVPASLAHAVIRIESNYRVNALGRAGEIGLMQIKPATARMMGYSGSAQGLYNPETNIKFGIKYLSMAHKLGGGTTCGTILKYNAGHAAKRMNPISARYCSKVKQHLAGA
nr:transglycosylase SLT domain-containing protein [Mesorhizobium albiziae]